MVYVKYSLQLGLHSHLSYQIHHGLLADFKTVPQVDKTAQPQCKRNYNHRN